MFVAASDSMDGSVTVMATEYQSWTLFAHGGFSLTELEAKIDELIVTQDKGAIWARIGEDSSCIAGAIALLKPRGFTFHHFARRTNEFVYLVWNNPSSSNKVPPFSTAYEGCSVVVLSPDETEVLLVLERGGWKLVSGVVEQGESALEACAREVEEETGPETPVGESERAELPRESAVPAVDSQVVAGPAQRPGRERRRFQVLAEDREEEPEVAEAPS